MLRLPVFVLVWAAFLAVKIPTIIAGVFVVPFLWNYRDTHYDDLPAWSRPWANPEDWTGGPQAFRNCLPEWWTQRAGVGFWSFFQYHAIRNPANGLRSFEWLDLDIEPDKVEFWTPRYFDWYAPWYVRSKFPTVRSFGYIAWQGWRAGVKFVYLWNYQRHFVIKIGWRIEPRDSVRPIDPNGIRINGAGFATKLLPYREG